MRIRVKYRAKISMESVLLFLAVFSICSYALLEHVSISISAFSAVKFPLLYVGGLCLMTKINLFFKNIMKKKYFYVLLVLLLVCGLILFSAVTNRHSHIGSNPLRSTIRLLLFMVELFLLMIWVAEAGKSKMVMDFLFLYVLILAVVTDFLFFTRVMTFYSGRHENYLIGTKFSVSYMHMVLLTFWYIRNNMRLYREGKFKRFLLLAVPFITAVSIRVDCMTGVLGCLALFVLFMMLNTRIQRQFLHFSSPVLLTVFCVASVLFPFVAEWFVSLPFVSFLVESVMARDVTLTGRLGIFGSFIEKMQGHMLWGFGFGNGNAAAVRLFKCANAQNALLQWVLETGLPATVMLVVLMVLIFRQLSRSPRQRQIMPLVVLVYVYIILGTVETTFNMDFLLWMALIFMQINAKDVQMNSPANTVSSN